MQNDLGSRLGLTGFPPARKHPGHWLKAGGIQDGSPLGGGTLSCTWLPNDTPITVISKYTYNFPKRPVGCFVQPCLLGAITL